MKLTSIFDCKEYTAKRWPPFLNTWRDGNRGLTVFCFARTPTGRVSQYYCALTFWKGSISEKRVAEWLARQKSMLSKRKKGYAWSEPYLY